MTRVQLRIAVLIISPSLLIFAFVIGDTLTKERIFALLSVMAAGLSGYFAISKRKDDYPEYFRESDLIIAFRHITYSDEGLAIYLIQIAIAYQAIASLSDSIARFVEMLVSFFDS